jgi:hypothetical protein
MRGLSAIERTIHELAAAQHGVVARRQLLDLGLGKDAIDHRLGSGRLRRLERGVYALGHIELRREGRTLAVLLTCGDDAVLSHRSAAALWGLRPWSDTFVELTITGPRGTRRRRGRIVHRSRDLPIEERTIERGIPVTSVARTLLDLAAVVPPHHLRRAVERSVQAELFDLSRVTSVLDAHPPRSGCRPLLALLADFREHGERRSRAAPSRRASCSSASTPGCRARRSTATTEPARATSAGRTSVWSSRSTAGRSTVAPAARSTPTAPAIAPCCSRAGASRASPTARSSPTPPASWTSSEPWSLIAEWHIDRDMRGICANGARRREGIVTSVANPYRDASADLEEIAFLRRSRDRSRYGGNLVGARVYPAQAWTRERP